MRVMFGRRIARLAWRLPYPKRGFAPPASKAARRGVAKCREVKTCASWRRERFMSVSGVSASSFFDHSSAGIQQQKQSLHQEFVQLGQDLQSGNLTAAQSDFAKLEQNNPLMSAASSATSA